VLLGALRSTHGSTRRLPRRILGPPMGRDARRGPCFLRHRLAPSSVAAARARHAPKKIQRTASPSCGPKRDPLKPSPRTTRSLAALLFVSNCRRRCRVPKGAGAAVSGGGPRCRRTRRQTGGRPGRTGASLLPPPSHTSTECLLHCPCVLRS